MTVRGGDLAAPVRPAPHGLPVTPPLAGHSRHGSNGERDRTGRDAIDEP